MRRIKHLLLFLCVITCFCFVKNTSVAAQSIPIPNIDISIGNAETPEDANRSLQILFLMTLVALSPYFLVMLTAFTRITITLHFLRAALGTQQMPPNQILLGLALFLTLFIMGPYFTQINENAIIPYNEGTISQQEALTAGMRPIKEFMAKQIYADDLNLFAEIAQMEPYQYESWEEMVDGVPYSVLIPSFLVGELTKGFQLGVILYIPFIVIDMVVASTLMAMGMMMLPPAMISLPFKILFFVMIDGWKLIIQGVILTFN